MRIDLPAIAKRPRNRKSTTLRDIVPPTMLATNLYAAAYRPIVTVLQRYTERLTAEYERTLSALTTDSPADISSILDELGAELSRLVLELTPALRDWLLRVETWQRGRWSAAVLSATGVDLSTLLTIGEVRETLETYLEWNVGLIRDVGEQARQRISSAVFAGIQNRTPARDVARTIREATGFARDRSLRIASDQLSRVSGALAEQRQLEVGIEQVEWKSSRKRHARPHHAARDGKRYYLATHAAVDGSETVERGDWVSQPPYCGCRTLSVLLFPDE